RCQNPRVRRKRFGHRGEGVCGITVGVTGFIAEEYTAKVQLRTRRGLALIHPPSATRQISRNRTRSDLANWPQHGSTFLICLAAPLPRDPAAVPRARIRPS